MRSLIIFLFSFLSIIIPIFANFFQNSGLISVNFTGRGDNVTFSPFVTLCMFGEQFWW